MNPQIIATLLTVRTFGSGSTSIFSLHPGEVQHTVIADRQKLVEQLRRLNDTKPELMAELRELRRREHEILDQVAERPAIETTAKEQR